MEAFFQSGRLIDLVLTLTLVEAAVILIWHRRTGRGLPPSEYALNLLSGLCLMLGIRTALTGADWPWTALCLMAAGIAHASDLYSRWLRRGLPIRPS
jgi:hypothetical protein